MKKKVILLATFAIIAGTSVLFAINRNSSAKGDCCKSSSSCNGQTCSTECSCGGDCVGENCACGCSCCE